MIIIEIYNTPSSKLQVNNFQIIFGGNWTLEAIEASEVAEAAEVYEAGEVSKP